MDNISYSEGKIISVQEDGILCRNKKGEFCTIPLPKFRHNQFVKTTLTYYSPKTFTRLVNPTYTLTRGWVYGERYIDRQEQQGGTGYSFEEDSFLPLDDARDILIARKLEVSEEISLLNAKSKRLSEELSKLVYALEITKPNESKG